MSTKITTILDSLSDVDFELLLRTYVGRQLCRMRSETPIFFHMQISPYESKNTRGWWNIGSKYGDSCETSGEILAESVTEQVRRMDWTSNLLQLEHQDPTATTATTAELIPSPKGWDEVES